MLNPNKHTTVDQYNDHKVVAVKDQHSQHTKTHTHTKHVPNYYTPAFMILPEPVLWIQVV